jgi:hypothetical protein
MTMTDGKYEFIFSKRRFKGKLVVLDGITLEMREYKY